MACFFIGTSHKLSENDAGNPVNFMVIPNTPEIRAKMYVPRYPKLMGQISASLRTWGQSYHFGDCPRSLGTVGTYGIY